MTHRRWVRGALAVALLPTMFVLGTASAGFAQNTEKFAAEKIAPASRFSADKQATSRLAQTDTSLLGKTSANPVPVLVKLDYDAVATYVGDVSGYSATSPTITGRRLSDSAAEKKYTKFIAGREDAFASRLTAKIPGAKLGRKLRTVYGGVSVSVPANKVSDLANIPGVVAVQSDSLRRPLTDSSSRFIGANSLYPDLGGTADAGKGVIFGVLDTGAWPEHPSFADQGNLSAPPARADGTARVCDFGENPLTPEDDPFACNNKLIGGQAFLDTYLSDPDLADQEKYRSARDSNGHGTHTGSTAAGNKVDSAPLLGTDRGPVNGIAPGAWVSVYKVCGAAGCFSSDAAAAVAQAVRDGVNVINYSIAGGTDPATDPVELAFLDAYAAGVFVATSAGNSGPTAGSVNHLAPWVTTVAASTQKRAFDSTLTLTADGGATATFVGASVTKGTGPLPLVFASAAPYRDPLCSRPAPAGTFTGKIVACRRGTNARVDKGHNVAQGGAAGMVLYNPSLADVETDNHWLPAVHLADGTDFVAFATSHTKVTASFTAGVKTQGTADVMAAFSSRGPAGNFVKPDVTAPGVQILAGNTPTPESTTLGPAGEDFMAIAGTSMSSPHTAGAAVLLKALHPGWTPGQIKSALMTTANADVRKEDETTPADPFDSGAGRIALRPAGNPGLTFDETAARYADLAGDEVNAVNLNLPSIDAPVMPGALTTMRTATNVTNKTQRYRVKTTAPAGSKIVVSPARFTVGAGKSVTLTITIRSTAATSQQFGEISLVPRRGSLPRLHLPVAFVPQQGPVHLTTECAPPSIGLFQTSTCTVTAANDTFADTSVNLTTRTSTRLPVVGATGATAKGPFRVEKKGVTLAAAEPGVPSIAPGPTVSGYLPLGPLGITPEAVGDEDIVNYPVPEFVYNGERHNTIGVDTNGYLVVGGGTATDNNCCHLTQIPDTAPPNNVLAPFWTDLDGTDAPGISVAQLGDGAHEWIVVQWEVHVWGTSATQHFQVWIGVNGTQDISFAYDPDALPENPGQPFLVGAENVNGSGGGQLPDGTLPTEDLVVSSTAPTPGGRYSYTVTVFGLLPGTGKVTSSMVTPLVAGTTVVSDTVQVGWLPH